jgi:hypothetical protein
MFLTYSNRRWQVRPQVFSRTNRIHILDASLVHRTRYVPVTSWSPFKMMEDVLNHKVEHMRNLEKITVGSANHM